MRNQMFLRFKALSQNESFARVSVAAFVSQLNPTMDELTEIKTAISEAVTNAIIHGYENDPEREIEIEVEIDQETVTIIVKDFGIGISDLEEARQPLFTTKPELERSGMGFTIIENFMDQVEISTEMNEGTVVKMVKHLTCDHAFVN